MARLDMIGLVVRSIPDSVAFYRLIGIEVPEIGEGPYHEATLPSGIRLSWNDLSMVQNTHPGWEEPRGQRSNLAFLCDDPAGVDRLYAEVTAAGHRGVAEPWDAFWGQRYAQVEDPDGNVVELFAPLG